MKIKIAKCTNQNWWYANKIGQEFEVLAEDNTKWSGNEEYSDSTMWWKKEAPSFVVKIPKSSWGLVQWEDVEGKQKQEWVNNPKHYNKHPSGVECIDVIEHMSFNLGNAVKYIWRCDLKKDAIEDLKKAAWYVQREIEKREKEQND